MPESKFELPTLIATSVVRGAEQGDSHGGICLVDFREQEVRQVVDWNTSQIDFQGRGWDRGLCVINDRIIAAGSSPSTITVYDLDSATEITRVNFSMDVRNAIHGLEIYPY